MKRAFGIDIEACSACGGALNYGIPADNPWTDEPGTWDIGFWIHPRVWRRGYATEAAARIVEFGFETLGAERIVAAAATWNEPSLRILERIGMTRTGTNPYGFEKRGRWVEEHEYEIVRDGRER